MKKKIIDWLMLHYGANVKIDDTVHTCSDIINITFYLNGVEFFGIKYVDVNNVLRLCDGRQRRI